MFYPDRSIGRDGLTNCIWHDDTNPSMSVLKKENKVYCHAEKRGGDVIDIAAACWGVDTGSAIKRLATELGIKTAKPQIVAEYVYYDKDRRPVSKAVKWVPGFKDKDKSFTQEKYGSNGNWVKGKGCMKGAEMLPYRLPELLKAIQEDETIYIVEGEKDVENLAKIGLTATCNAEGAGKWTSKHSMYFNVGTNVVILSDNDEPGAKHAESVGKQLFGRGCCVKIVNLPNLPLKGDISDWLAAGHTKSELLQLVEAAPYWEPQLEKQIATEDETEWTHKLDLTDEGKIKSNANNFILIFENDETFNGLCYNEMTKAIELPNGLSFTTGDTILDETVEAKIRIYIERKFKIRNVGTSRDALVWVACSRSYHPIKKYLADLPKWDGVKRAETIFINTLGANNSEYIRVVTRTFLAAAYQRIINPGCKFDLILVLRGPQGIGKSVLVNRLGVDWSHSSLRLTDMKDTKVAAEKILGYWVVEIPELAGMSTADLESTKAFITATDDVYRAAYARKAGPNKRQSVMIASTNSQHGYLRDTTGGRRFIDIECAGKAKMSPLSLEREYVDQIWAEVKETLLDHPLYLSGEFLKQAEADQQEQIEQDPREDIVAEYLDKPIPGSWYKMPLYDRQAFLDNRQAFMSIQDTELKLRPYVCIAEIWEECFKLNKGQMQPKDRSAIHRILMRLGWRLFEGKKRCGAYGAMKGFERP